MTMYNPRNTIIGIIIFIAVFTFPLWYNAGAHAPAPELDLDTPTIAELEEKECIEDAEYMRQEHMSMLNEWKDIVVRDGKRVYTAEDGEEYEMSLQNTCMDCHSNKEEFCDTCHDYVGLESPTCWDCHVEPKEEE